MSISHLEINSPKNSNKYFFPKATKNKTEANNLKNSIVSSHSKNHRKSDGLSDNNHINDNNKSNADEMIKKRIARKKQRISKSENFNMGNTITLGSKRVATNSNESITKLFSNTHSSKFTTNIQNNVNININTQNVTQIHNPLASPKLRRNLLSFGANTISRGNLYKTVENGYLDSLKNILENKSILKLKEELLETRIRIDKLQNENNLLREKLKTSKSLINFNKKKSDMLKTQYQEIINFYRKENEKNKKSNITEKSTSKGKNSSRFKDIHKSKNNNNKTISNDMTNKNENAKTTENNTNNLQNNKNLNSSNKLTEHYLTSTLRILLDIIELFITQKPINTNRDSVLKTNMENISYSIDIYDSYYNEDDRRSTLIDQIQSVLLSKLNFLSSALNISLEKEILKVKNWNKDHNSSNISLSNISQYKLYHKKDSNVKEKDTQSVTSSENNSFNKFHNSPKFYRTVSGDSLKDNNDLKIRVFEIGKDEDSVGNNSSLQNDSLDFGNEVQFNTSCQEGFNLGSTNNNKFLNSIGSFGNLNINMPEFSKNNNDSNGNNSMNDIVNKETNDFEIKILDPEVFSDNRILIQDNKQNIAINNINISSKEIENENSTIGDNSNKTQVEPELKFTSTFKKLSIDLNDDPTDFNIEDICVNNLNQEDKNPVILLPILANKENSQTNNNPNLSFTDF